MTPILRHPPQRSPDRASSISVGRLISRKLLATELKLSIVPTFQGYRADRPEKEADYFFLLGYWIRRATPKVTAEKNEITTPAKSPRLALVARLHHATGAASCQEEKNFSGLSLALEDLCTRLTATKVEQMMLIRLNQESIPEVRNLVRIKHEHEGKECCTASASRSSRQRCQGVELGAGCPSLLIDAPKNLRVQWGVP